MRMILPVRARLHEKWKRNERERLIHQAASSTIDPAAAATLLSQNPGILHSAAVDFQKKAAPKSRTGASTAASKNRSSKTKSSSGNNSGSNSSGKGGVGGAVTGTSSKMSRNSSSGSMSSMGMSIHASAAPLPAPNPVSVHPQYYTLPAMPTFNRASGGKSISHLLAHCFIFIYIFFSRYLCRSRNCTAGRFYWSSTAACAVPPCL